jgi:arylsulfatase A-like enzyme
MPGSDKISQISKAQDKASSVLRLTQTSRADWALVQEVDALEHSLLEDERKRLQLQVKQEHLQQLNKQRAQLQQDKDNYRNVWRRWKDEIDADARQFKEDEELKRIAQFEVRKRFEQEQRQQLDATRERQHLQALAERTEGLALLQRAKDDAARAQEEEARRKKQEREDALKLVELAHLAKAQKEVQRLAEVKRDQELQKNSRSCF